MNDCRMSGRAWLSSTGAVFQKIARLALQRSTDAVSRLDAHRKSSDAGDLADDVPIELREILGWHPIFSVVSPAVF